MYMPPEVVNELQQAMGRGGSALFKLVPKQLQWILEKEVWKECQDKQGRPFASFEAFVTHKLWWGLESSIDDLLSYCRKAEEVQKLIREQISPIAAHGDYGRGRPKDRDNNIISKRQGTDQTYTLARLRRDRPDLAARVIAGELSANAAAIAAGFRRKTWTAPVEIEELAAAIARRYPGWKLIKEDC
jgi:hypothetical protein